MRVLLFRPTIYGCGFGVSRSGYQGSYCSGFASRVLHSLSKFFLWGPFSTLLVLCFQWVHRFNFSVIQCIGLNLKAVGCLCCKFMATFNPRHFMKPNIGAWIITILFLRVPCYDYTKTDSKSRAIK